MARATVLLLDSSVIDDAALASFASWLSPSELARYGKFARAQRRRQFLAGRVLLRQALAPLLGVPARAIALVEQSGAAPRLALPAGTRAGFSISHSGPWVACAVSADTALGLDIEVRDETRDLAALAGQAFDADTCASLAACAPRQRVDEFYRLWSTQEARIKLGAGGGHVSVLDHPQLAVILCSGAPLTMQARLVETTLLPEPVP
jgi:4'-phosphopantetheinyl transferase